MTDREPDPNTVRDRDTFIEFLEGLIAEREHGEQLERASPDLHKYVGAHGWQNGSIAQFLECALAGATSQEKWGNTRGVSWHEFAVFLYLGKIYE